MSKSKLEEFFTTVKDVRKRLKDPITKEDKLLAAQQAVEIFSSDQFGDLLSLSNIYKVVE